MADYGAVLTDRADDDELMVYPVSKLVNSPQNNSPDLFIPVAPGGGGGGNADQAIAFLQRIQANIEAEE